MAEQALRRHHDERLAQVAQHLAPEHVKHLGRRRRNAYLHIELRAQLQKPLKPRRRVLGPLALIAMRQEQSEAGYAAPLSFARADELVDDDLRAVGKIAELTFPDRQP